MPRDGAWRDRDDARPDVDGHAGCDPADDEADDAWERARRAARSYFIAVPPFRIAPERDSERWSLSRKRYEFWGEDDPAAATHWPVLSTHENFEAAERRLRHIISPPVYYDTRGQLAQGPPSKPEDDGLPPDDEDE